MHRDHEPPAGKPDEDPFSLAGRQPEPLPATPPSIAVRTSQSVPNTNADPDVCCDEMDLTVAEQSVGPVSVHVVFCEACEDVRESVVVEP